MKILKFLKNPGLIVTAVVVISIIVGAGAMAALAHNPAVNEPWSNNDIPQAQISEINDQIAKRQAQIAKRQAQIVKRQEEIAKRKEQIAKRHEQIIKRQEDVALRKEKIVQNRHNLYAMHDKRIAKKNKTSQKKKSKKKTNDSSIGVLQIALHDFTGISATGAVNIVFTQGESDGYAEVHGDQRALDRIRFSYNGTKLNIGYKESTDNISTRTIIYLTNPELESVNMSGATSFTLQGTLKTNNFKIAVTGASDINIPHIIGETLNINATGASNVNIFSSEMETINTKAAGASDVKLKGICAHTVISSAMAASEISVSGRCNRKKSSEYSASSVKDQGLIIENNRLDCNSPSKKKTMPRKP